ncbi:MerR family transcriptional regulator [Mycolicibacterium sp.]|uniref:MerR family transcriptional regulator n=1 Tax=Mycolicibacterium sp. TaxID=2320850 RepID=UPI001A233E78|nr:MerR family transcriptional regulator [Mycolicibacterium sp.]MBJ7341071.1 MerR family transcriptional regulator [Mycolicibacterium sp.]
MTGRLSIGDFSRMTHLSVKTLRHYHEAGLLPPAEVDPSSNYRYYLATQIPVAQTIRRFRDLGMPVREVADLLAAGDPNRRGELIAAHLGRLETQLEQTRIAAATLRRLLDPDAESIAVQRRSTEAMRVAAISGVVSSPDVLTWYADAMTELDDALDSVGRVPTGPPGGLYDNALFTDDRGELVVYVPVPDPPRVGRVAPLDVGPTELAVTVHNGAHDDIDVTYGALGVWVDQHALAIAGPVHETYLVRPRDTPEESAWRTEIGWPVRPNPTGVTARQ